MSDPFQKKVDQVKQTLASLKKDIRFRQDLSRKGQTTYQIDAQIRGNFTELDNQIQDISKIISSYQSISTKIPPKEIQKRKNTYNDVMNDRQNLKKRYDGFFEKRAIKNQYTGNQNAKFTQKYDTTGLNTRQLDQLRTHQLHQQDQALDNLIGAVQNIKGAGMAMNKQFDQQNVMLDTLEKQVDDNTSNMGRVRGKMVKLLQQSSNWCLGITIVAQIVGVICILVLWK